MKGIKLVLVAVLLSFLLHLPTLSGFFTNDDFFHFQISRAASAADFINFFNPLSQPQGYGWYRPLANQVYYFLGLSIFSLNPVPMRFLMLVNYLLNIVLVWYFIRLLTKSEIISGLTAFLYSVSASLFASVYLVGVQERPLVFFFLLSAIFFLKYLNTPNKSLYIMCFLNFIFALWCKESTIILPLIFISLIWLFKKPRITLMAVLPFLTVVAVYMYLKIFFFGFAVGDSYVWQLSPRILNTFTWYSLWSVNIPEMFVDYIGPGFHVNPNLMKYWAKETTVIAGLFFIIITSVLITLWKNRRTYTVFEIRLFLFGLFWFAVTIAPVLGLPLHKFPHYLSVPLVGSLLIISIIIKNLKPHLIKLLIILFSLLFFVNFSISTKTHWAYTGEKTVRRVHNFIQARMTEWPKEAQLVFYDTPEDDELPWGPSATLKTALSDNSYFTLFYPHKFTAVYLPQKPVRITPGVIFIPARQFLGY